MYILLLGFLSGGIEVGLELIGAFIPGDGLSSHTLHT